MASHTLRLSFCVVGLMFGTLYAQTPPQTPAEESRGKEGRKSRQISPELAAALAAGVKFDTPAVQKKEEEEPDPDVDLREVDRPRNAIIRLPKYVVEGERPPVFAERELHTSKGLADLAVKRYLSDVHTRLNRFHLPSILGGISSESLAMEMYREEERLKNIREFDERVYLYRQTGDNTAADELKEESQRTFMRRSEFIEAPRANGK